MKRTVFVLLLAGAILPWSGSAATNAAPVGVNFQDFKIITQRNIFDPNRHAGSGSVRRVDPSRLARAEGFSLVGTLLYDREALAFFDGTDSRYRKVLKVANNIADYKITEVTDNFVKLEANGNEIKLPVGMQMKKIDAGDWRLMDGIATASAAPPSPLKATTESTPDTGSDADNEILKKLMQKRAKELNK